jgi:hypothetical protein
LSSAPSAGRAEELLLAWRKALIGSLRWGPSGCGWSVRDGATPRTWLSHWALAHLNLTAGRRLVHCRVHGSVVYHGHVRGEPSANRLQSHICHIRRFAARPFQTEEDSMSRCILHPVTCVRLFAFRTHEPAVCAPGGSLNHDESGATVVHCAPRSPRHVYIHPATHGHHPRGTYRGWRLWLLSGRRLLL